MHDVRRNAPSQPAGFVAYSGNADLDSRLIVVEDALKRSEFERAVTLANAVLRDYPGHAEAQRLLAAGLRGCGRDDEAVQLLRDLAERHPDNALIHNSLGAALRITGDLEGAGAAFARACELAPGLAPGWYNLAVINVMREQLDAALEAANRVVELVPNFEPALVMRTNMMREQGRIQLVQAEYRKIVAQNPRLAWAWFMLANLKNAVLTQADLDGIDRALALHPDPGHNRTLLLFARAQALDDLGRYDEAFAVLSEANASVRSRLAWDAQEASRGNDAILAAFRPPPVPAPTRQGREVIFVVSLPRSGSTLAEQILASHPQVEGAGELHDLQNLIEAESQRRGMPLERWARDATPDDWDRLGKQYLQMTAPWRQKRPRMVDKMLGNWRLAGAALAMLPETRIVVCRRDPLENCFSCYRQMFAENGHPYSYDVSDMARYWHDFDRLCRGWRELHPDRVYDMVYEELLADQETKTRELLAFCGLDFDPACLRFHETERKIKTISSAQVREPLKLDTARAPRYGALLDPLRAALAQPYGDANAGD